MGKDKRDGKPRRSGDCPACNKEQWNIGLKVFTSGAFAFVVAGGLWGWAAWASSEAMANMNARLSTAEQMIIDDRLARVKQTKIIENIERLGNNRNIMIVRLAAKFGVEVDLDQ